MAIVVPAEFGFLARGEVNNFNGFLNPNRTREAVHFTTGSIVETVNISSAPRGNPSVQGADIDIRLFKDVDNDGILDTNKDAPIGIGFGRESVESINQRLSQGSYFIEASTLTPSNIPYSLRFSRQNTGQANPLTTPEIPLGTIEKDLRRRDAVDDTDTADNYAFSLKPDTSLNIKVQELGNLSGEVNIRVVRDLDADGVVDKNEILAKGISTKGGLDEVSVSGRGDYILQVCQSQGSVRYQANFDVSNTAALKI